MMYSLFHGKNMQMIELLALLLVYSLNGSTHAFFFKGKTGFNMLAAFVHFM